MGDDVSRNDCHGLLHIAVRIMRILHRCLRVADNGFHVGDAGDVRDVNVAHVVHAAAIGGNIDFVWSEREPADRGP